MQSDVTTLEVSKYLCAAEELGRKSGSHGGDLRNVLGLPAGFLGGHRSFRLDSFDVPPEKAFWIVGRDGEGRVAHIEALRLDDLSNTDIAEHLGSLGAWFVKRLGISVASAR
ncbi:MAG: hypothetical protein E5V89_30850 [Mesorhizobium sp.]|uniref:hypothetical protein n=1 Tax=Mesorhizobium sp. TaxID=1871066 RepID=UPI000FE7762A|nr:hypothetical protein [Mesorhizobium sp.]RWA58410.1 MAG: hypothetical protein EOQ28_33990 [Mesorhizobium sp.]TIS77938.1 MAG: hypothetical protein E5W94_11765 [Mesorhizobium sp.]TIV63777.1 MAG: hypothetical protein E5V89_30850 [Mesorhizobium sp.]